MSVYSAKDYWADLVRNFGPADEQGLAPVLHPQAPLWFNQCIDDVQYRAVRRALAIANLHSGAWILDVGCGTGRWVRRVAEAGFDPMGMDETPGMLGRAREFLKVLPLTAGAANDLPFADATFNIPALFQPAALAEMVRVLKPGGRMMLLEPFRGRGAHDFPRSPEDWIEQVVSLGMELVGRFGQEFLMLDRAFVRVARAFAGKNGAHEEPLPASQSASSFGSIARRMFWSVRRITALLSAWTDPLVEKICPARLATHGVFKK